MINASVLKTFRATYEHSLQDTFTRQTKTVTSDENGQMIETWADGQTYACGFSLKVGRESRNESLTFLLSEALLRVSRETAAVLSRLDRIKLLTKYGEAVVGTPIFEIDSEVVPGVGGCIIGLRRVST